MGGMSRIKIKSIQVEGFRGVAKAQLPINGMTLLVGKNSTGKSSLIQSLLILAQSKGERVRTNGSILMLGDAKDSINDNSSSGSLLYRFEFEFAKLRYLSELSERLYNRGKEENINFNKPFIFEMRLKPNFEELSGLSVQEMVLKQDNYIIMQCENRNVNNIAVNTAEYLSENINAASSNLDVLRVLAVMNREIRTTTTFLNGFNPEFYHFKLRENVIRKNIKKILLEKKMVRNPRFRRRSSAFSELAELMLRAERRYKRDSDKEHDRPDEVHDNIDYFITRKVSLEEFNDIKEKLQSKTMAAVIKYWEILEEETKENKEKIGINKKKKIINEIATNFLKETEVESSSGAKPNFELLSSPSTHPFRLSHSTIEEDALAEENLIIASRLIGIVTDGIDNFLAGIRYLGPLRAEPKAAYGSAYTTPNIPLGINGGSTAEYLHRSFIRSPTRNSKKSQGKASLDKDAKEKLDDMVKTIGIGDHVEVEQVGRFGYAIKIKQHGADRDLTEMGTGVSQVIPVLALLLSAPRHSLVILEQPELHLHPAIQSGLAQLLYKESERVNIVCETHSEYIVTRLRKIILERSLEEIESKISQNEVPPESPETKVDFVWAEPCCNGDTKKVIGYNLSPIDLDEYNDILIWPDGFFDDQTEDVDAILSVKNSLLDFDS
jgi:hypothetical protein